MFSSFNKTSPLSTLSEPEMILSKVVLPEPFDYDGLNPVLLPDQPDDVVSTEINVENLPAGKEAVYLLQEGIKGQLDTVKVKGGGSSLWCKKN